MNMFKSSVDPDSSYALDIGRPEGMVFIFKCKPPPASKYMYDLLKAITKTPVSINQMYT